MFQSTSVKFLRFYNLGMGIFGLIIFVGIFVEEFFLIKTLKPSSQASQWNLHCMFLIIASFLQIFANILLIIGSIKQCHQEIRAWLIITGIGWVLTLAGLLSLYDQPFKAIHMDTRFIPLIIVAICIYGISCDIVYSYYSVLRGLAYNLLNG